MESNEGYLKGSRELGENTGIRDRSVHGRWRMMGLPFYLVGSIRLYRKKDVDKFLEKEYGIEMPQ